MNRSIKLQTVAVFILVISFASQQSGANPLSETAIDVKVSALDLILLHNNDLHGHFDETCIQKDGTTKCFGGFARHSTIINKYRNDHEKGNGPPVLFFNAGDTYTGTPWFALFKDRIASEMMNALKPDASTLGNHEFDHGVKGLVPFLDNITFPMVVSNLNIPENHPLMQTHSIKPSVTFNINGIQIGVIGYITPETKQISTTEDVEFFPEIESINREAEQLNKNGVQIIIALGHSGYDKDKEIASDCPLVDVVVGGHSHSFLYTGTPPDSDFVEGPYPTVIEQKSGKKVPVVQASKFSKYIGKLELSFDEDGNLLQWNGAPILLDYQVNKDPAILELLDVYRPEVDPLLKDVAGYAKVDLIRSSSGESNLGNLIADAFVFNRVQQYNGGGWTDAPIALVNSGGIRDVAYAGNVTRYQLSTILPFGNNLMQVTIPGYVLKQAFEKSAEKYDPNVFIRGFLQISGARVVYDLQKEPGHRVQSLDVLCGNCSIPVYEPVDDHKLYGIVIESYLYDGGDGMTMFKPFKAYEMNLTAFDAAYNYMKQIHSLYPAIEGRATLIGTADENHAHKSSSVSIISNPYSVMMIGVLLLLSQVFAKIC